jgi:hypothetical protein
VTAGSGRDGAGGCCTGSCAAAVDTDEVTVSTGDEATVCTGDEATVCTGDDLGAGAAAARLSAPALTAAGAVASPPAARG